MEIVSDPKHLTKRMFGYGKMSANAVAAVSALAERYPEKVRLSSLEIAKNRNLSQPLVAKVLTILSQHGLVEGSRGPGGGYRLTRHPKNITVLDIVELFEGHRDTNSCPFGPGWCGVGEKCPLHDTLERMVDSAAKTLGQETFDSFIERPKGSLS